MPVLAFAKNTVSTIQINSKKSGDTYINFCFSLAWIRNKDEREIEKYFEITIVAPI